MLVGSDCSSLGVNNPSPGSRLLIAAPLTLPVALAWGGNSPSPPMTASLDAPAFDGSITRWRQVPSVPIHVSIVSCPDGSAIPITGAPAATTVRVYQ